MHIEMLSRIFLYEPSWRFMNNVHIAFFFGASYHNRPSIVTNARIIQISVDSCELSGLLESEPLEPPWLPTEPLEPPSKGSTRPFGVVRV